jgi:hypothetical protein
MSKRHEKGIKPACDLTLHMPLPREIRSDVTADPVATQILSATI